MSARRCAAAVAVLAAGAVCAVSVATSGAAGQRAVGDSATRWAMGAPIVTYWGGPNMSDSLASRLTGGGWNLGWCGEADLDLAARHGLRCQLRHADLSPVRFEKDGEQALRLLVRRVRHHPSLYSYFLVDEPSAAAFPVLRRMVAVLREEDPAHAAYINLLPIYATNAHLGTAGRPADAYRTYVRRFVKEVEPELLSFDHYNLLRHDDRPDYFLNLAIIRQEAAAAGIPFLNIVQASSWDPAHRVPTPAELRFLVHTSIAYGAQGLSYYVLSYRNHAGGAIDDTGAPTSLFEPMARLNGEFVRLVRATSGLASIGVFHVGAQPEGTSVLPLDAAIQARVSSGSGRPGRGLVLALYGTGGPAGATHAFVVNADHRAPADVVLRGRNTMEGLRLDDGRWVAAEGGDLTLTLAPGDGRLLRVRRD